MPSRCKPATSLSAPAERTTLKKRVAARLSKADEEDERRLHLWILLDRTVEAFEQAPVFSDSVPFMLTDEELQRTECTDKYKKRPPFMTWKKRDEERRKEIIKNVSVLCKELSLWKDELCVYIRRQGTCPDRSDAGAFISLKNKSWSEFFDRNKFFKSFPKTPAMRRAPQDYFSILKAKNITSETDLEPLNDDENLFKRRYFKSMMLRIIEKLEAYRDEAKEMYLRRYF